MLKLSINQHISLESLRGLSALLVLFAHVFQFYLARFYPEYFSYAGLIAQASVMVFFSMSGFLIGKSIQANCIKNGYFSLSQYAESRFKRIYPPLILSIVLVFVLYAISPYVFESGKHVVSTTSDTWIKWRGVDFKWPEMVAVLSLTNGLVPIGASFNSPLWSLPFEVWYYVVAGLLFTKKPFMMIVGAIVFISISFSRIEFFVFSSVWLSGLLISYIRPGTIFKWIVSFSIMIVFLLLMCSEASKYIEHGGSLTKYNLFFGLFFSSFIFIILILMDVKINILPFISSFSYTLYITHYPILFFVIGIFESKVLHSFNYALIFGLISVAVALSFSYVMANFVENKIFINKIMTHAKKSKVVADLVK